MEENELREITELGSSSRGRIHCLTIIGQVEGHMALPPETKTTKYEHVMPLLAAVEESEEVEGLLVLLNTVGGDIEAGLGIAELIASLEKPTASVILGGGHSIGVPLAVSASPVLYRPLGGGNHPPGASVGGGDRRTSDVQLFCPGQRPDRPLCHGKLPHHQASLHRIHDPHRGS